MDRTGRIHEMEERLNRAAEALARLDSALEDLEGLRLERRSGMGAVSGKRDVSAHTIGGLENERIRDQGLSRI